MTFAVARAAWFGAWTGAWALKTHSNTGIPPALPRENDNVHLVALLEPPDRPCSEMDRKLRAE